MSTLPSWSGVDFQTTDYKSHPWGHDMDSTHYETLGVLPPADIGAIHAAYESLIVGWNEEWRSGHRRLAETRIREINEAFAILANPQLRAEYDAKLYCLNSDGRSTARAPSIKVNIDRNPHTFNSLQHLVMAMADFAKSRGKRSFFGHDKSLGAYRKFEDKLQDTILALEIDGVINRRSGARAVIGALIEALNQFAERYPNWQDAYAFAYEFLVVEDSVAEARIHSFLQY